MEKGCLVVGLAVLLAIGLYIFWGWLLSMLLAWMFNISIAVWQGAVLALFISLVAD